MKKTPFLLRRCDLAGCNRQGAFLLSDGRAICDMHGFLFLAGNTVVEAHNEKTEEAERAKLPDFEP